MDGQAEPGVQEKIERLGRVLWWIGTLGIAVEILTLAYDDLFASGRLSQTQGHLSPALVDVFMCLSYLFPLVAMRGLGRSLMREEALSLPVAKAFRRVGHATLLYALFRGMPDFVNGFIDGFNGTTTPSFHLDVGYFSDLYLPVIACVCLYSVAHLMKLAAEAADDARGIV